MAKRKTPYILILPGLFTTGNLFCGFYSILQSFEGDLEKASYLIIVAAFFDALDGRVARITGSISDFGVQFDSIADVVSFGLAPTMILYQAGLVDLGRAGMALSFFYVVCGALRLARFNTTQDEVGSFFEGLPSPAAAIMVATSLIFCLAHQFLVSQFLLGVLSISMGLLMISSVRYRSFKDFDLRHRRTFPQLTFYVIMFVLIITRHEITLPFVLGAYILWAPVQEVLVKFKRGVHKNKDMASTSKEPMVQDS